MIIIRLIVRMIMIVKMIIIMIIIMNNKNDQDYDDIENNKNNTYERRN